MADQMRHDWVGAAGTPGVVTPAIDGLIGRGKWLTSACTNSAICVPARISLATGHSPERLRALGNEAVLGHGAATHYQHLRDHGYRVGAVGKLDLAKSDPENGAGDRPAVFRWGFTHPLEVEGKMHAGAVGCGRPLGPYGRWLRERGMFAAFSADYARRLGGQRSGGGQRRPPYDGDDLYRDSVLPAGAFADHWVGQRAVDWIRHVEDDHPWQLFVSFPGPHDPFDAPAEWGQRFRDAPVPQPIPAADAGKPGYVVNSAWRLADHRTAAARRQYTATVALIDAQIGDILAAVDARGQTSSTIVAIASDHGEMLGDHGLFQKSVPYESAMRVPLIVAGPGIASGVSDALIELADLGPTLVDLVGLPAQEDLDARSFASVLRTAAPQSHRDVAVCSEHHYIALRSATYKYINNTGAHRLARPDDLDEVYELTSDPEEQHNLLLEDPTRGFAIRDELIDRAHAEGQPLDRLSPRGRRGERLSLSE